MRRHGGDDDRYRWRVPNQRLVPRARSIRALACPGAITPDTGATFRMVPCSTNNLSLGAARRESTHAPLPRYVRSEASDHSHAYAPRSGAWVTFCVTRCLWNRTLEMPESHPGLSADENGEARFSVVAMFDRLQWSELAVCPCAAEDAGQISASLCWSAWRAGFVRRTPVRRTGRADTSRRRGGRGTPTGARRPDCARRSSRG